MYKLYGIIGFKNQKYREDHWVRDFCLGLKKSRIIIIKKKTWSLTNLSIYMTQLSEEHVLVIDILIFCYTVSVHKTHTKNIEGQKHTQAQSSMDFWKTASHNLIINIIIFMIICFLIQKRKIQCPKRNPKWTT